MTRAALQQLLDKLPEAELDRVAAFVRAVNAGDRLGMQLATVPEIEPDEYDLELLAELTPEDLQETESLDEVCAQLGLE
jgi:hypothetical protein